MTLPILQFGTSRFLQAHVDLFVSDALARGEAVGGIAVVQTTGGAESRRRVDALKSGRSYPVLIRGLSDGKVVDEQVMVSSVGAAFHAMGEWGTVCRHFIEETRFVVSNVGDRGYELKTDEPADAAVPMSFPAKLLRLLTLRHEAGEKPVTILPCELISGNGSALRAAVLEQARRWKTDEATVRWIVEDCVWIDTLVDRIVSQALEPVGAVAEPYALWAIANRPGFELPCRHPAIALVDDLAPFERLKLFILNLGHTVLADRWIAAGCPKGTTTRQATLEDATAPTLGQIYENEVIPVFAAADMEEAAVAYVEQALERFANPFLDHRLSAIATNHAAKVERRIGAFLAWAEDLGRDATGGELGAIMRANGAGESTKT